MTAPSSVGWVMVVVVAFNLFGFAVSAAMQGVVSGSASGDAQGRTMGAVASLNSLMAVAASVAGAAMLGFVSHLPQGDWRIGMPYCVCAALQALAMGVALRHFTRQRALGNLHSAST